MNMFPPLPTDLSRRRFVQGVAIGGAVAGFGLLRPSNVWALTNPGHPTVLSGTDFALDIAETPVNVTGATRLATTVNGSIPGPILRWKEGTTVNLRVTNRLRVPTSIHWHGIILPFQEDGVPGISRALGIQKRQLAQAADSIVNPRACQQACAHTVRVARRRDRGHNGTRIKTSAQRGKNSQHASRHDQCDAA